MKLAMFFFPGRFGSFATSQSDDVHSKSATEWNGLVKTLQKTRSAELPASCVFTCNVLNLFSPYLKIKSNLISTELI